MLPTKYALSLYRGDSFARVFRFWQDADKTQPTDLSDILPAATIRLSGGTIPMVCTVTLPNEIAVTLEPSAWGSLTGAGVWDLQFTYGDGTVRTPIGGTAFVYSDVTGAVLR